MSFTVIFKTLRIGTVFGIGIAIKNGGHLKKAQTSSFS